MDTVDTVDTATVDTVDTLETPAADDSLIDLQVFLSWVSNLVIGLLLLFVVNDGQVKCFAEIGFSFLGGMLSGIWSSVALTLDLFKILERKSGLDGSGFDFSVAVGFPDSLGFLDNNLDKNVGLILVEV